MERSVIVEGRALRRALKIIGLVVERRPTIPILGHVRLAIRGADLDITGTDLEREVTTTVDVVQAHGDWSICVDAKALAGIARVAGPMCIRIVDRNEHVEIHMGDGEAIYTMDAMPADDFPELKAPRGNLIERFADGALAQMLGKVQPYVSSEETRYYLNGVCWQIGKLGRRFVATDGHRLGACRYSAEIDETINRIIPKRTVTLLIQATAGRDVEVSDAANALVFATTDLVIKSKLIDGTYPDVDRVIPKTDSLNWHIKFPRDVISAALSRAVAMGIERSDGAAIKFVNDAGKIAIERRSASISGSAKATTPATWPVKTKLAALEPFGFNSRYLAEILGGCSGEIDFGIIDPSAPFSIADADETMTRVLMPMRV